MRWTLLILSLGACGGRPFVEPKPEMASDETIQATAARLGVSEAFARTLYVHAIDGCLGPLTPIPEEVCAADRGDYGRSPENPLEWGNAAGGNHPKATTNAETSFFDLPKEALGFVFDLNIMGTIMPSQIIGKQMAEQGEGVILNISSMNAFRPLTRIPAYSAAKAGVSNFTQWLAVHIAQEYSPRIRVNAIAPGFFVGNQNRALLYNDDGSLTARGQQIIDHTPMGRFGNSDELLGTVLWLLSPAAQFVSGIIVPVDGGFSAYSGV